MPKYGCTICCLLLIALVGCALKNPHQRFVEDMNTSINYNITIDKLADPNFDASGVASKKYLTEIEDLENGNYKYHYAYPNIFGRYCHYHFLVDGETKKLLGWDFDYNKSDPATECGSSG